MRQWTRRGGLLAVTLLVALGWVQSGVAADKLQIYAVNYPLAYFAERISGDLAEVSFPTPPDVDPAFWMPDAETIANYQSADLILLNGADYAKWAAKVSLPRSRTVDTSRAFRGAYIHASDGVAHSHGPGGKHSHGGVAFTTWLDLRQAAQQAEAIAAAVIRKRPDAEAQVARNLQSLQQELLDLDAQIAEVTGTNPDLPLVASHPVYQYFARRYGLKLTSLMWEPEEMPSDAEWSALEKTLTDHPAKWMLWEGDPASASVERLQALGVASVVVSPCSNRPAAGDFLTVMSRNLDSLEQVFGGGR